MGRADKEDKGEIEDKADRVGREDEAAREDMTSLGVYRAPNREADSRAGGLVRSLLVRLPGADNNNWDFSYTILILLRNLDELHPMFTLCGQEGMCSLGRGNGTDYAHSCLNQDGIK